MSRRMTRRELLVATEELCARDHHLAGVVDQYGPSPLWARKPNYATLVQIILEQQVSLASARAVYQRFETAIGKVDEDTVSSMSPMDLHKKGFTRQKAEYCVDLARMLVNGDLSLRRVALADDDNAREMLTGIRGIGRWTADIYLLMSLGRPDIWPQGDVALASAMQRVKCLRKRPDAGRQNKIANTWRPWRSVGARLMWHFYLSEQKRSGW